jgi:hypothetical protein
MPRLRHSGRALRDEVSHALVFLAWGGGSGRSISLLPKSLDGCLQSLTMEYYVHESDPK